MPGSASAPQGTGRPLITAAALLEQVIAHSQQGRPATAVRLATRGLSVAAAQGAEAETRARLMINLAVNLADLGRFQEALTTLDRAVETDPGQAAAMWSAKGRMLVQARRLDEALAALDTAVTQSSHRTDRSRSAALLNRGLLHMALGRVSAAHLDTHAAVAAATEVGDQVMARMARHNLGYVRFLRGDIPGALSEMEIEPDDDFPGGVPAMDRARVLTAAGLLSEALESIHIAIADFESNRSRPDLIDALLVAADIEHKLGLPGPARDRVGRVIRLASGARNRNVRLAAQLVDLGIAASSAGTRPGWSRLRRIAELAEQLDRAGLAGDAVSARLHLAELHLDRGDLESARQQLSATRLTGRTRSLHVTLHARLIRGRLELAADRPTAAFAQLRGGLDELADFQARFGSQDMQAGAAIHGAALARLGLRTAVESGSPAAILQWLERARAVSTRLPAITAPADPELAELLGALRFASSEARAAVLAGSPDPALDRRVSDLRRQVRARSWVVAGVGRVTRPLSLAAVQRGLRADPADPTVIAYLTGNDQVHALVITAGRATFRTLTGWADGSEKYRRLIADLDMLAAPRVPAPVRAVAKRSLAGSLARWSAELIDPLADRMGSGPVVIAGVGDLATLPWAMLPGLRGRGVSVHSSVTAALRPAVSPTAQVLAVAGPEVADGPKEVLEVAGLYPQGIALAGPEATGAQVLQQIPDQGVLHIAAHGHHETENPLFSSVQLADGPLFAYDIAPNPALPALVVLSSCDVGRTLLRPGGEPLGLAAALLRSGVSTVIAGVARIADGVAAEVMGEYHRRLTAGAGPARALAAAVEAAGDEPAPFTCFGAGG